MRFVYILSLLSITRALICKSIDNDHLIVNPEYPITLGIGSIIYYRDVAYTLKRIYYKCKALSSYTVGSCKYHKDDKYRCTCTTECTCGGECIFTDFHYNWKSWINYANDCKREKLGFCLKEPRCHLIVSAYEPISNYTFTNYECDSLNLILCSSSNTLDYVYLKFRDPFTGLKDNDKLLSNFHESFQYICQNDFKHCDINNVVVDPKYTDISDWDHIILDAGNYTVNKTKFPECRLAEDINCDCNETKSMIIKAINYPCFIGDNVVNCDSMSITIKCPESYIVNNEVIRPCYYNNKESDIFSDDYEIYNKTSDCRLICRIKGIIQDIWNSISHVIFIIISIMIVVIIIILFVGLIIILCLPLILVCVVLGPSSAFNIITGILCCPCLCCKSLV